MIVKFNKLMANCAIYSTALDIMVVANELFAAGHPVNWEDLATVAPYITSKIRRFGDWILDLTPAAGGHPRHPRRRPGGGHPRAGTGQPWLTCGKTLSPPCRIPGEDVVVAISRIVSPPCFVKTVRPPGNHPLMPPTVRHPTQRSGQLGAASRAHPSGRPRSNGPGCLPRRPIC